MKKNIAFVVFAAAALVAWKNSPKPTTQVINDNSEMQEMKPLKKGFQLYTIRENMVDSASIAAAFAETQAMGYEQVETFGYMSGNFFGYTPEGFNDVIRSADMKSPSGHYLPMELAMNEVGPISTENIPAILDAAEALGQKWIIIPWMSEEWRTPEGYEHLVRYLSELGDAARERGIIAAWHNHDFEFAPIDPNDPESITAYDYLLKSLEGTNVVFEMDLHWVAYAGENPVEWFENYPGRFPLWHVKDFAADTVSQVPVGHGVIEWEHIFNHAKLSGLEHYFIEQDVCSADRALDCLKESLNWAKEQKFIP